MPRLTETIMKSSQVSRIIISACIVAAVGLLTYNWAVSPQASYLNAAQRYETVSQDLDKKARIIGNQVRVKEIKRDKLLEKIKACRSSFFRTEQATNFFASLEKMADLAGCNLESMLFANEVTDRLDKDNPESPKVIEKNAILKITGTYGQIVDLTSALKDYPLKVYISNLQIMSTGISTNKLSCSMNIKVYLTEDKELLLDD